MSLIAQRLSRHSLRVPRRLSPSCANDFHCPPPTHRQYLEKEDNSLLSAIASREALPVCSNPAGIVTIAGAPHASHSHVLGLGDREEAVSMEDRFSGAVVRVQY